MPVSTRDHRGASCGPRCGGDFRSEPHGRVRNPWAEALATLERVFTNSASRLELGQAQYTIMCADDGGTIDDLIVYRLGPEHYMLCVNASNIETDREWLAQLNGWSATFEDVSDGTALVAIQGPVAVAILATLADFPIAGVARFGIAEGTKSRGSAALLPARVTPAKTASSCSSDDDGARDLFEAILAAGAAADATSRAGRARHVADRSGSGALWPRTRSQHFAARSGPGGFRQAGATVYRRNGACRATRARIDEKLVGLRTDDGRRSRARATACFEKGDEAGVVTSGTFAP